MRSRTVALVVFDGVQGLDVFGPADVFFFARYHAEQAGESLPPYDVVVVGPRTGR